MDMPLAALVEQVATLPADNTTVFDQSDFVVIRAPKSTIFRSVMDEVAARKRTLAEGKEILCARGLLCVVPLFVGPASGSWLLVNMHSGVMELPAGNERHPSLAAALAHAVAWWTADPACREVVVLRSALEDELARERRVCERGDEQPEAEITDTDRLDYVIEAVSRGPLSGVARYKIGLVDGDLDGPGHVTIGDMFRVALDRLIEADRKIVR